MPKLGISEVQSRCLVTVVGVGKRADLAIPADAPIAEYADKLARILGAASDEALPPSWSLAPLGERPLPLETSLAAAGIVDGAVLYLRDILEGDADEPVVQSVYEVVSDVSSNGLGPPWDTRAKGRAAILLGAVWLLCSLGYLGITGRNWPFPEVLLAVTGLGLAATARGLAPYPRVLPRRLRIALACSAIPAMILVSVLSTGGFAWDGQHLVYAEIGAILGFAAALTAVPSVLLAAVTLLALLTGALMTLVVGLGATTSAAAATAVAAGTLFLAIAPRTAGLLTATSWLRMSSSSVEPDADPEKLGERVLLAQHTLVTLMGSASAVVAVALIVLTRDKSAFALVLAGVAVLALLIRAATFMFTTEAIGPVVAASAGLFGLLTALGRWATTESLMLPIAMLAGVLTISTGIPLLLWRTGEEPGRRPQLGGLLTLCQLAMIPLALGVYGLYSMLWNVGQGS